MSSNSNIYFQLGTSAFITFTFQAETDVTLVI